jgi:hypothetical protein
MASSHPRLASHVVPALAILVALSPSSCGARTDLGAPGAPAPPDASASMDAGIASEASVCDHAAIPLYGCSPLPLKEGICQGGPPDSGDEEADASYPIDCLVTLPSCDPSSGAPLRCKCSVLQMNSFWACGFGF